MRKKLWWMVPLGIIGMVVFAWIGGEVVMHLWNWLLPPLFGWHQLTFWQALGLLALCRILFGGLGHGGPGRRGGPGFRGRCRNMSSEEREKFRKAMEEGYGFGSSPSGKATPSAQ